MIYNHSKYMKLLKKETDSNKINLLVSELKKGVLSNLNYLSWYIENEQHNIIRPNYLIFMENINKSNFYKYCNSTVSDKEIILGYEKFLDVIVTEIKCYIQFNIYTYSEFIGRCFKNNHPLYNIFVERNPLYFITNILKHCIHSLPYCHYMLLCVSNKYKYVVSLINKYNIKVNNIKFVYYYYNNQYKLAAIYKSITPGLVISEDPIDYMCDVDDTKFRFDTYKLVLYINHNLKYRKIDYAAMLLYDDRYFYDGSQFNSIIKNNIETIQDMFYADEDGYYMYLLRSSIGKKPDLLL